jgi:hypothetical protein
VSVNEAVDSGAGECVAEDGGNIEISKKWLAEMGGNHRRSVPCECHSFICHLTCALYGFDRIAVKKFTE